MAKTVKKIKGVPEGVDPKDASFLKGKPTRVEVMNFVESYIANGLVPSLKQDQNTLVQQLSLGLVHIMALQALLIEKGLFSQEEMEEKQKQVFQQMKEKMVETSEPKEKDTSLKVVVDNKEPNTQVIQ